MSKVDTKQIQQCDQRIILLMKQIWDAKIKISTNSCMRRPVPLRGLCLKSDLMQAIAKLEEGNDKLRAQETWIR